VDALTAAKQKRLLAALALLTLAMVGYDAPAWFTDPSRVVSNTVDGNLQTVVMDLTKFDPWAMHAWVRQLCFALICVSITLVGWASIPARALGISGVCWYLGQAADAYLAGNLMDDGYWEYSILTMGVVMNLYMIRGWTR